MIFKSLTGARSTLPDFLWSLLLGNIRMELLCRLGYQLLGSHLTIPARLTSMRLLGHLLRRVRQIRRLYAFFRRKFLFMDDFCWLLLMQVIHLLLPSINLSVKAYSITFLVFHSATSNILLFIVGIVSAAWVLRGVSPFVHVLRDMYLAGKCFLVGGSEPLLVIRLKILLLSHTN